MSLTIDNQYLFDTLVDLIGIDSVNPDLVPGGAGEAQLAGYLADKLRKLNLDVTTHEPVPGRISVVGALRGTGEGRSLMLNAHEDTVGVEDMDDAFMAVIKEGKLYGRGAYDMKGALAACMAALKALVDAGVSLPGDVLLSAVADEEYASIGTADILKHYRPDGAVVAEATGMDVCLAHKGFVWLEVETLGRAAHGSRPDEGVDANMHMGRVLCQLEKLEHELRARPGHPLTGPPSLHASLLQGGTALSVYAAHCRLGIERRTVPGETEAQVVGEIQSLIDPLAADPTFKATVRSLLTRDPFEVSSDARIVQALRAAAAAVLGRTPAHVGQTFWMDSALFSAAGVETVVMGPIGAGAHAKEEWVDLQSLVDLAGVLAQTALRYSR